MKFLILTIVTAGLLVGCADQEQPAAEPASPDAAGVITTPIQGDPVVYAVDGMTCEGCANSIQDAVVKLPAVNGVVISLDENKATVYFANPDEGNKTAVANAINELGYTATVQ